MSAPKPGQFGEPLTLDERWIVDRTGFARGEADYTHCERIVECVNALDGLDPAALAGLIEVVRRIVRWDSFPNVVDRKGELTPYGLAYGSNGERDFMRDLASKALAALGVRQ